VGREASEIDNILDTISVSENELGKKEIVKTSSKEVIDVEDETVLAEELFKTVKEDRLKADKIFDLFYPEIGSGKDRSTASKEALTKALELKIQAANNIIELLKLKNRAREQKSNVGVFIGDISPKKAGISIQSLQEEINE